MHCTYITWLESKLHDLKLYHAHAHGYHVTMILLSRLIMMEKTKDRKGGGCHWDIVLLSLINCLGAIFGGPWICAATVRACSHVSALTVMSTTHAPGEAPKVVEVKGEGSILLLSRDAVFHS